MQPKMGIWGYGAFPGDFSGNQEWNAYGLPSVYYLSSLKVSGSQRLQRAGQQRAPDEAREEFGATFVLGGVGAATWREDDRGRARDHTQVGFSSVGLVAINYR